MSGAGERCFSAAEKEPVMSKIILLVESGSDVTPELARRYGIAVVPMHVSFGTETKDDGDFPTEDIVTYFERNGKIPQTSGCNPEDFARVFDRIHREDPDAQILYLAYSAVTTCSFDSARAAAEGRDYVTALDTKQVSAGQCAVTVRMARLLEAHPGWSVEEALVMAQKISQKTRMAFIPRNLDFPKAGGRVSNVAAMVGNLMRVIPCVDIIDGRLIVTRKYRGRLEKVVPAFIKEYAEANRLEREELWAVITPGFSDGLKALVEQTAGDLGFRKVNFIPSGGVITTHGGPSALGIAGYQALEEPLDLPVSE